MTTAVVTIRAEWDDEAGVWVIASPDVPGLNLEAATHAEIAGRALAALEDLADYSPEVARLVGRPLEIVTTQRLDRRAVA